MQEGGAVKPDIHKCRLHSRQHAGNAAIIDIPDNAAAAGALDVQLLHRALLDDGNPGFLRGNVDENFAVHNDIAKYRKFRKYVYTGLFQQLRRLV